jgi:hypothetical protein
VEQDREEVGMSTSSKGSSRARRSKGRGPRMCVPAARLSGPACCVLLCCWSPVRATWQRCAAPGCSAAQAAAAQKNSRTEHGTAQKHTHTHTHTQHSTAPPPVEEARLLFAVLRVRLVKLVGSKGADVWLQAVQKSSTR